VESTSAQRPVGARTARQVVRKTHRGPYRICVVRAAKPYDAEMYRAGFRRRLPNIRIPLRKDDKDAILRL
jgi:hypothetical protein